MHATLVTSEDELQQILDLQQLNLKQNISADEKDREGFVTMPFTMDMLLAMHKMSPSVIVKENGKLLAYAIVFLKEGRHFYPGLEPMFVNFERTTWKGKPFTSHNYYIIGQICVAKEARGKGVVEMLYNKHREEFAGKYECVVTEIATSNRRSLRAHEKIGFEIISHYRDDIDEWEVVVWEF